jgi:hypothetical protein
MAHNQDSNEWFYGNGDLRAWNKDFPNEPTFIEPPKPERWLTDEGRKLAGLPPVDFEIQPLVSRNSMMTNQTLNNLTQSYNQMSGEVAQKTLKPSVGLRSTSTARFSDNSQGINSEVAWSAFYKDLQKFFETHGTLPVNIEDYFPHDTNLLSTVGMLGNEAQQELMKHNLNIQFDRTTGDHDSGIMKYTPKWLSDAVGYDEADSSLAITDPGYDAIRSGQQSVDMHEYLHYIDSLAGDTTTGMSDGQYLRMSDIMKSYSNADGSPMTKDQLYARWMDDPRTSHLDLDNPKNAGLRTLLSNRSHHGGVVDLRDGFGKFLATVFSDQGYRNKYTRTPASASVYSQADEDYYLGGQEMFARAGSNILRKQTHDEGFTPGLFQGMDKGLADSIATLLNSR